MSPVKKTPKSIPVRAGFPPTSLGPQFVAAFNRGMALYQAGQLDEAAEAFREAIALDDRQPLAYNNLGAILKAKGHAAEAVEQFNKAIAVDPKMAMAHSNLGSALVVVRRYEEAEAAVGEALRLQPDYPEALNNLTNCLLELGRLDEAKKAVDRALELKPDYAEAYSNLGAVYAALGDGAAAVRAFKSAVALIPDLAMAHKNMGLALLREDKYADGWVEYEWRWTADGIKPRNYPKPLWRGEPLTGKTLLLYAEQGLGDAIQFARFVPVLAGMGARVILEVHPPLVNLMGSLAGVADVVPLDNPPASFDMYQALMSVGGILGVRPDSIPAPIPYLHANPARVAKWRERLGDHGFKVGIAWQGKGDTPSQRSRSATLDTFAPLAGIPDVRLISLQKGPAISTSNITVETLGPDFDEGSGAFVDTAAVMKCVDLVVTIDTSVAHVAGALGVPTWIVLKYAPDWRWGMAGTTSAWYPQARLFRQREIGRWDDVFAEIAAALSERSAAGPSLPAPSAAPSWAPAATVSGLARARDYARLDSFLAAAVRDMPPTPASEPHVSVTRTTIEALHRDQHIKAGDRLLDVGCGQGVALAIFRELGVKATGIALGPDVAICRDKGFDALEMDQNFLDFPDRHFDVLWCRQILQHSALPLFTLTEYRRVTKPGGLIYVEVPAPDTSAHHENASGHLSVLPWSSWMQLFTLSGCAVERGSAISFTVATGSDTYWSFLLRPLG